MPDSSPSIHRAQKELLGKLQEGTIVSVTTLTHPLSTFGRRPRHIGLILLEDGSQIIASLLTHLPIGTRVRPRMRLSRVNEEGLRIYDIAYEALSEKPVPITSFPGYILALTGPSGVGKSTVSTLLMRMFADYVESVPIVTTRERRESDNGEYRYVSKNFFTRLHRGGELIAITHIPSDSEERWYGYRACDIEKIWSKGKLPVVVTEMHLLQGLSNRFGRRSILSFGLLPPGKSKRAMLSHLLRRLRQRGRETEANIRDRLKNAEKDLAFFSERQDLFDRILVNEDIDAVIENLRRHIPGLPENS